jgi:hypothetical protein
MRVYLDNCCYNRPFDEQGQLRVRDVNAERFIALTNRNPRDYTKWRAGNMYVGESVHDTAARARAAAARLDESAVMA